MERLEQELPVLGALQLLFILKDVLVAHLYSVQGVAFGVSLGRLHQNQLILVGFGDDLGQEAQAMGAGQTKHFVGPEDAVGVEVIDHVDGLVRSNLLDDQVDFALVAEAG